MNSNKVISARNKEIKYLIGVILEENRYSISVYSV